MRKRYAQVFKNFLCKRMLERRRALDISQEEMAHKLGIAGRTYVDIEHGVSGCNGLTLVLFLLFVCDDPMKFLEDLRRAFKENDERVA